MGDGTRALYNTVSDHEYILQPNRKAQQLSGYHGRQRLEANSTVYKPFCLTNVHVKRITLKYMISLSLLWFKPTCRLLAYTLLLLLKCLFFKHECKEYIAT